MLEYASNTDVVIEVPYEYNGTQLTLTAFEYEVLDADGQELIARQADPNFSSSATASTLTIPAASNTTALKRDARLVNCFLTSDAGEYVVSVAYVIKGNVLTLTPLTDSFMTFPQSLLTRARMAEEQADYDMLSDELKCVALEEAFNRISKLKFKIGETIILDIKTMNLSAFNALSTDFLLDLRKAQIAEANAAVENSPVREKIRSGIISETIGESSMFFKQSGFPANKSGLSDDTERYLKRWIYLSSSGANTWRVYRA